MKLAPKLVLTGIIAVSIAMGGLGYLVIISISTDMLHNIENRLAGDAQFAATRIQEKQDQISAITRIISKDRGVIRALDLYESRGINQRLNDEIAVYPFINYILVAEPDGFIFAASTRDGEGEKVLGEQLLMQQVRENPLYTPGIDGAVVISEPGTDPYLTEINLKRERSQWFQTAIKKRGEVTGWLILSVDWETIHHSLLDDIVKELKDTGNPIQGAFITNDLGLLISRDSYNSDKSSVIGGMFSNSENHLLASQRLTVGEKQCNIIVMYDREQAMQPVIHARRFVAISVFVGSVFLGGFLFFVVRKMLLVRINILHQATQKIGEGDVTFQLPDLGRDEVADLAQAMNRMVTNLRNKTTSIDHLSAEITLREQAEREMEKAKCEAEDAAKAKSEFLASMSHEIRTPMNGVLGMLGLLAKAELSERQHEQVIMAENSAQSLLSIINDILDFSKIEAGKLTLEEMDFNLRELLEVFCKTQSLRVVDKSLELILDTRQLNYLMVVGDPGRLRQILNNLVGNSLKFTHTGEIAITADIHEQLDGSLLLTCAVSDTGIGIPVEKQALLFDAFTQADASTTRQYGGTGLGLSITKQLCELMGGKISVQSEPDKGSCFEFSMQLKKSHMTVPTLPTLDIRRIRLLIVDDCKTNREVLRVQLLTWGVALVEVSDVRGALEVLHSNATESEDVRFDLVLLDMQAPKKGGIEQAKRIREDKQFDRLKLVMMVPVNHCGDNEYYTNLGIQAYVQKPIVSDDLVKALTTISSARPGTLEHSGGELHVAKATVEAADKETNKGSVKTPSQTRCQHCRILLVEDNYINQEVAKGILDDWGIQVDVAENGLEAIQALLYRANNNPYQLVLMDCQMPEMDGYETTKNIRQGQAGAVNQTIPIVAMTANAMRGDRENCLAAGMNEYITKPLNPEELENILNQWLPSEDSIGPKEQGTNTVQEETENLVVWDQASALKRLRNKEGVLLKIVTIALKDVPTILMQLKSSIENDDNKALHEAAHALKGVAGNISAKKLAAMALTMEQCVKSEKFESLGAHMESIEGEWSEVSKALQAFQEGFEA